MNKAERACKIHWLNLRSANSRYRSFYTLKKKTKKKLQFNSELDLNSIFFCSDYSFEFSCFGLVFFKKKSSQFKKIRVIFELFFELIQTKNRTRNKQKLDFLRWQLNDPFNWRVDLISGYRH